MKDMIVILYTTLYRKGGSQFKQVAETMALEKEGNGAEVLCKAIESKEEIKSIFREINAGERKIVEYHFVGHAGMYGPMYGTTDYPEQFSPFELRNLNIPFTENAEATFHCCRSARWFAPYFARVQQVQTNGYHWYTSFSSAKTHYKLPIGNNDKLYCFGCHGKKSHGLLASVKKHVGLMKAEPLKQFSPEVNDVDDTYNSVAAQYAETFKDIKVRKDEFNWLLKHMPNNNAIKALDIGCGNGALLKELSSKIDEGIGVDVSENLIYQAREQNKDILNLSFKKIEGPILPFEENSFDLVISLLSFRYLDWDPLMLEIERVLNENGKLIIIDMVTAPVKLMEWPSFLRGKLSHYLDRFRSPEFYKNLRKLVTNPEWSQMLKYNPIRSQHEMKWYLESRFPGRKVKVINVGLNSRIVAFDSGDMKNIINIKLTYP